MKFSYFRKEKGFTFIELIFYVGILAVVLVIAVDLLTGLIKSQKKGEVFRKVWENASYAARRVSFEVENADSIYYCQNCQSVFDNDAGYLSLETSLVYLNDETSSYVDIYLNPVDFRLYLKREGLEPEPITSDEIEVIKFRLTGLAFDSYNVPTSLKIQITVKQKGNPAKNEYKAETNIITTASIK